MRGVLISHLVVFDAYLLGKEVSIIVSCCPFENRWFPRPKDGESMRMYSLFDRKMKEFGAVVLGSNDEVTKRALREGAPQMRGTLKEYPEDFDLYFLGEFEPETGVIVPASPPLVVENVAIILEKGGD